MNTTGTKKRTYDEQFKRDAVALLEGGRKAAQLARELGISHWNLRDWKERYGTGAAAPVPWPPRWRSHPFAASSTPSVLRTTF